MELLLMHLQQTAQPPIHPPSQQQPPPQPMQQQQPPSGPSLGMPVVPAGSVGPQGVSSAPPLATNPPGRSLGSYFPDMKAMLLLEISKHEFNPGQLFKINPQLKDWPKDANLQLSDMGILIKTERDASPKEYPSFRSLHNPPYILQHPNAPADCIGQPANPHSICSWLQQVHVRPVQTLSQIQVATSSQIPLQIPQFVSGWNAGRVLWWLG